MSYWSVGVSKETGEPPSNMEQRNSTGEEMGAKASPVEASDPNSRISSTLENIKAAYDGGDEETARELIQQACCVECSRGIHPDGVSH
ncbi:hypothetical protein XENOCAPTIV_009926 [Xenoophorus captivus]|uniref:Uncharacterized protein n=2 Tax=Goodeidae TaxID=28758 RepID=A0ABV0QA16_9TELE